MAYVLFLLIAFTIIDVLQYFLLFKFDIAFQYRSEQSPSENEKSLCCIQTKPNVNPTSTVSKILWLLYLDSLTIKKKLDSPEKQEKISEIFYNNRVKRWFLPFKNHGWSTPLKQCVSLKTRF